MHVLLGVAPSPTLQVKLRM